MFFFFEIFRKNTSKLFRPQPVFIQKMIRSYFFLDFPREQMKIQVIVFMITLTRSLDRTLIQCAMLVNPKHKTISYTCDLVHGPRADFRCRGSFGRRVPPMFFCFLRP